MAGRSKIEWCDATWNPVVGCSPVSEGCEHCFAARMATRLGANVNTPQYRGTAARGRWTGAVNVADGWDAPLHWKKPRRIFVCSMGDLFHEGVRTATLDRLFNIMANTPRHTFLLLTKRPERMRGHIADMGNRRPPDVLPDAAHGRPEWPPRNVWLGVTAENQARADERIPLLLATPAARRFVSVEPMLSEFDLRKYLLSSHDKRAHENQYIGSPREEDKLDWVICGGETGPGARPMNPDWARSLRDQCEEWSTPFFFKKMGNHDKSGRLDGREWKELPS